MNFCVDCGRRAHRSSAFTEQFSRRAGRRDRARSTAHGRPHENVEGVWVRVSPCRVACGRVRAGGRNRRCRQRYVRRRVAGCDRGSGESRADRKSPQCRDRRRWPVQDRRAASWHLQRDVHADRVQHVQRDGVELSAGFTATINADLRVGALEETITVSGQSPIVDTQNVTQQKVITMEVIQSLPNTGTNFAALTPGAAATPTSAAAAAPIRVRRLRFTAVEARTRAGSSTACAGTRWKSALGHRFLLRSDRCRGGVDSARGQFLRGRAGRRAGEPDSEGRRQRLPRLPVRHLHQREFQFDDRARRSESPRPADHRCGRRRLRCQRLARRSDQARQAVVLHREPVVGQLAVRAGLTTTRTPRRGPTCRTCRRPAVNDNSNRHNNARFTWQAAQKHRLNLSWDQESNCVCHTGLTGSFSPEGVHRWNFGPPNYLLQATWSYPMTNKLLFEAGNTSLIFDYPTVPTEDLPLGTSTRSRCSSRPATP